MTDTEPDTDKILTFLLSLNILTIRYFHHNKQIFDFHSEMIRKKMFHTILIIIIVIREFILYHKFCQRKSCSVIKGFPAVCFFNVFILFTCVQYLDNFATFVTVRAFLEALSLQPSLHSPHFKHSTLPARLPVQVVISPSSQLLHWAR